MQAIKILDWRPLRRNSLVGFAKIEMPSGMIIADVTILTGSHGLWASPPAKPMIGRDNTVMKDDAGKVRYVPVIEFVSKAVRDKWSAAVIAALQVTHPEAVP